MFPSQLFRSKKGSEKTDARTSLRALRKVESLGSYKQNGRVQPVKGFDSSNSNEVVVGSGKTCWFSLSAQVLGQSVKGGSRSPIA